MYQDEVFNQKYWWIALKIFLDLTATWDNSIFYDCTNFAYEKSVYSWCYYHIMSDSSNFLVFSLNYPLSSFYLNLMKLRTPLNFLQIIFKNIFIWTEGDGIDFQTGSLSWHLDKVVGERTTEVGLHLASLGPALHSHTFPSPIKSESGSALRSHLWIMGKVSSQASISPMRPLCFYGCTAPDPTEQN